MSDEEFKQLRENIFEAGEVFNPLLTWQGTIIDGHNRWKVIQEDSGIHFKTHEMIFFDRDDAKEWIIKNQLGRRNLTPEQRLRLIGQMHENRKKSVGEHQGNQYSGKMELGQNEPIPKSTAAQIAKDVGVSESTVKRAERFSKGIDTIEAKAPEAAAKILKGCSGITKEEVMRVPKMEEAEREELIERVMNPPAVSEPKQEPKEYTINDLVLEIEKNAESYLRFLKSTLVSRSTLYADAENRLLVYNAVSNIKAEVEKLEKLLK